MPPTIERLMPPRKHAEQPVASSQATDGEAKKKTCQLFEDVVFWAGLIGSFEGKAIAEVLDDVSRKFTRERLKTHKVDPDEAYSKYLAERPSK